MTTGMVETKKLKELLNFHAKDVKDPYVIFELAKEYDRLKQGAAAVGLYIKAADLTDDKILQYKAMILAGKCYDRQGNRSYTVIGMYMDAANVLPSRPEAYHFLAAYHEQKAQWKDCKLYAQIGLGLSSTGVGEDDEYEVGYPGRDWFYIQKSLSDWLLAGTQDAREQFFDIAFRKDVKPEVKADAMNRIQNVCGVPDSIYYLKENTNTWNFPFNGVEKIEKNNSKHFQDMFVLSLLDGKRNGIYLEIGSGHPIVHSNTYLLEKEFGWKGISIDINPALCYDFTLQRNNTCLRLDATAVEFETFLNAYSLPNNLDYLQIDCDEASINVLKQINFRTHSFNVITFEHDSYRLGTEIRDQARQHLLSNGYALCVPNVSFWGNDYAYEDWYVHKSILNNERVSKMISKKDVNFVWDYFYVD